MSLLAGIEPSVISSIVLLSQTSRFKPISATRFLTLPVFLSNIHIYLENALLWKKKNNTYPGFTMKIVFRSFCSRKHKDKRSRYRKILKRIEIENANRNDLDFRNILLTKWRFLVCLLKIKMKTELQTVLKCI